MAESVDQSDKKPDLDFVTTQELWDELIVRYDHLFAVGIPKVKSNMSGRSVLKGAPIILLGLIDWNKADLVARARKQNGLDT